MSHQNNIKLFWLSPLAIHSTFDVKLHKPFSNSERDGRSISKTILNVWYVCSTMFTFRCISLICIRSLHKIMYHTMELFSSTDCCLHSITYMLAVHSFEFSIDILNWHLKIGSIAMHTWYGYGHQEKKTNEKRKWMKTMNKCVLNKIDTSNGICQFQLKWNPILWIFEKIEQNIHHTLIHYIHQRFVTYAKFLLSLCQIHAHQHLYCR